MKHLILFLILSAYAHAKNPNATIDVRVLALGNAGSIPDRFLITEEGYEKMSFSNRQASEIIKAYGGQTLPLFVKAKEPDAKSEYAIAEQVKLPQNTKSVLLLCWTTPQGKLRYYPINDSIMGAGYNDWLMINTTSKAVGFRIGQYEKPVILKPKDVKNYKVRAEKGKGVPVVGKAHFNGETKTFYSTYWRVRKNERSIIIFTEVGNKIRAIKMGDSLVKTKDDTPQAMR